MRGFVLAFVLVGLAAFVRLPTAHADTRPRVAVLGLEVTSAVDVRTTELAHDLTEGIRTRARIGSGPYAYAPSSERELIDEKLIKQCDNEAPACMAEIGKELDADVIVYGKLEKEDKVVRLSLHLLEVAKKAKLNRTSMTIPTGATKDEVKVFARKAYEELAGASSAGGAGTVEVEANVAAGTVFVDDSSSEVLENGKATLTLPEGRYRIAVESPGKQRKEITVTVKAEQVITQEFDLVDGSKGSGPEKSKFTPLNIAFASTTAIGVGLGLYSLYLYTSWTGDEESIRAEKPMMGPINQDDCDGGSLKAGVDDKNGILTNLCATRNRQIWTGVIAGVFGLAAATTAYFVFIHKSNPHKSESATVSVTPVLTPTSAGASLQLDF